MDTIILRESGHSYFGETASKFVGLDNELQKPDALN